MSDVHPMFVRYRAWLLEDGQPRGRHRYHSAKYRWKASVIAPESVYAFQQRGATLAAWIARQPIIEGADEP